MSEASQSGRPAPQEFEKVLASATTTVASFDEEQLTFIQRAPALPACLSDDRPVRRAVARRAARRRGQSVAIHRGEQFLHHPDAGDGHRHCRHRADAGDPDRRHRSVDRPHHGHFVGRDGAVGCLRRRADVHRFPARHYRRVAFRLPQRHAGHPTQDAAVYRHARHAQHHRGAQHVLFAERNHRHAGHRRQGAVPAA